MKDVYFHPDPSITYNTVPKTYKGLTNSYELNELKYEKENEELNSLVSDLN